MLVKSEHIPRPVRLYDADLHGIVHEERHGELTVPIKIKIPCLSLASLCSVSRTRSATSLCLHYTIIINPF